MGFRSILTAFVFVIALNMNSMQGIKTQDGVCICPGIQKPVCRLVGPSGIIHKFNNLCEAKCRAEYGSPMKLVPGSLCTELSTMGNNASSFLNSDEFQTKWLTELESETDFYGQHINVLMERLLIAVGVPYKQNSCGLATPIQMSEMNCLCPPAHRPYTTFGPSGNLIYYDNLCVAFCKGGKHFIIFPWILIETHLGQNVPHPGVRSNIDAEEDFDLKLGKWKEMIQDEIYFWEKIGSALKRV